MAFVRILNARKFYDYLFTRGEGLENVDVLSKGGDPDNLEGKVLMMTDKDFQDMTDLAEKGYVREILPVHLKRVLTQKEYDEYFDMERDWLWSVLYADERIRVDVFYDNEDSLEVMRTIDKFGLDVMDEPRDEQLSPDAGMISVVITRKYADNFRSHLNDVAQNVLVEQHYRKG